MEAPLYRQVSTLFSTASSTVSNAYHQIALKVGNRATLGTILQVYNAVTATAVLITYLKNREEASSNEYLFDIAAHLVQAGISDRSPDCLKKIGECMNALRLSSIAYYEVTGTSTIPNAANVIDLLNHGGNLAYLLTLPNARV